MKPSPLRKLLFLSESVGFGANRDPGGGELFAIEFLSELLNRGWEISVVCPEQSPLLRDPNLRGRVAFHALDLSAKITQLTFLPVAWGWLFLSRRFRTHIMYGNGYVTMKWLVISRILWGTRIFCHLHESSYECYRTLRARVLAPFVHRFFAISDSVRDLFIKGAHVSPPKVIRVHNGVPISEIAKATLATDCVTARQEVGVPADSKLVAMIARTNELKGHEVLLRSVNRVRASVPNVRFLILGLEAETPDELALYHHLQGVINREQIRDVVLQFGFRPDARRFMRCADVVVVPSTQEGFGRTAIEAMAEQTPVIASAAGGLKEIITDGVDGRLFPPGDHDALAEQLTALLRNPDNFQAMAQRGYLTARAKFSTRQMTELIESHLLEH